MCPTVQWHCSHHYTAAIGWVSVRNMTNSPHADSARSVPEFWGRYKETGGPQGSDGMPVGERREMVTVREVNSRENRREHKGESERRTKGRIGENTTRPKVMGNSGQVMGHSVQVMGHSVQVMGHSVQVMGHSVQGSGRNLGLNCPTGHS